MPNTDIPKMKRAFSVPGSADSGKIRAILTAAIILAGIIGGVALTSNTSEATQRQAEGVIIDFEEYNTVWYGYDYKLSDDPFELLGKACVKNGYTYTTDVSGKVTEINGISDGANGAWSLWYVEKSTSQTVHTEWVKSGSYSIKCSDYAAVAWAYRADGKQPTVAVDATGTSVYGYPQAKRVVSLSPTTTETVCACGASDAIVGTDLYSNYPEYVNTGKNNGSIAVVGTYTDPSFELVMKQTPDLVVGDKNQYNQTQLCRTIRNSNVNTVVIYSGENIDAIYDNTFLVGVAAGYGLTAKNVISNDRYAMSQISNLLSTLSNEKKVMVALSPDASPYVGGNYTYVGDILGTIRATNAFGGYNGWAHINTEMIAERNPDVIIITAENYSATEAEWNAIYNNLPDTWKTTKAYADKEIYILCEKAVDLGMRPSPRFPQLAELTARIVHPEAFGMTQMQKFIGNDFKDQLTLTKDLG